MPSFARYPEHRPYRDAYRRTWDARGTHLVVYPWERYGVCFFDTDGRLASSHEVNAPRLRVTADEKERVLREAFGGGDRQLPFLGVTGAELYHGKWPAHGPNYTDVVMAAEDEAWLLRRADGGRVVVDVFRLRTGYAGSFIPPDERLPLRVSGGTAVSSRWDDAVRLTAYRLAGTAVQ